MTTRVQQYSLKNVSHIPWYFNIVFDKNINDDIEKNNKYFYIDAYI